MKDVLVPYTYSQFKEQLAHWMQSGHMIWAIFGNFDKQTVLEVVKDARAQLNIKATPRAELPEVHVLNPEKGDHRVDFRVEDESNDNSCLVSYY